MYKKLKGPFKKLTEGPTLWKLLCGLLDVQILHMLVFFSQPPRCPLSPYGPFLIQLALVNSPM